MSDDDGRLRWFGESWGAPICEESAHVDTPVGDTCSHCGELVDEDDQGVTMMHWEAGGNGVRRRPLHYECHLRTVLGSVGHQRHTCSCFGGTEGDPPGLTARQAARAAVQFNGGWGTGR